MCMCSHKYGKPNINGQPGYSWNGEDGVHPVHSPELEDGDELVYDEPGRCGGVDAHSHHFRLVKRYGQYAVVFCHGGGVGRFVVPHYKGAANQLIDLLAAMDSNMRYWMMHAMYHVYSEGGRAAREDERAVWVSAAVEKRIKLRRRKGIVRVEIGVE